MTHSRPLPRLLSLVLALPAAAAWAQAQPAALLPELAAVHAAATPAEALALVQRLAARPGAAELGVGYLHGDLLERLGRTDQAARAFAGVIRSSPALGGHARYRLARLELAPHPEIAAGLLAPLLAGGAPPELRRHAAVLLRQAIAAGGDCRLLEGVEWRALPAEERRALLVQRADCARGTAPREATAQLVAVLAGGGGDEPGREAAIRLSAIDRSPAAELALSLGRAFQRHRRPDLAWVYLAPLVERLSARPQTPQVEALELLAEAQVARGQPPAASALFARLAALVQRPDLRARALYREGWALELAGNRAQALSRYVQAANLAPGGEVGPAALLAACRAQWRLGRAEEAMHTYRLLRSRREWEAEAQRAGLFLAASQLARGEEGNSALLLQHAVQQESGSPEVLYWQGRLAERQERGAAAVASFARLVRSRPHHPLAGEALARLRGGALAAASEAAIETWRRSARLEERLQAWLLLPADDPRREPLRLHLYQRYTRDPAIAPYLRLAAVPPGEWPLWRAPLAGAEERLLALGGWEHVGLDVVLRHFPLRQPPLAFTAAQRLARAGDVRRSVRIGDEMLALAALPVPLELLPVPLRELLLPQPWESRVRTAAGRHGLDPSLLWALMRAGSGFDPQAISPWGGRGLLLVDARSAERLAAAQGLPVLRAEDLFQPRFAIPLGAANLAELERAFPGRPLAALAAYLAGPPQARLWASWCVTNDSAELLTKIESPEVREALVSVLSSRAAYAQR